MEKYTPKLCEIAKINTIILDNNISESESYSGDTKRPDNNKVTLNQFNLGDFIPFLVLQGGLGTNTSAIFKFISGQEFYSIPCPIEVRFCPVYSESSVFLYSFSDFTYVPFQSVEDALQYLTENYKPYLGDYYNFIIIKVIKESISSVSVVLLPEYNEPESYEYCEYIKGQLFTGNQHIYMNAVVDWPESFSGQIFIRFKDGTVEILGPDGVIEKGPKIMPVIMNLFTLKTEEIWASQQFVIEMYYKFITDKIEELEKNDMPDFISIFGNHMDEIVRDSFTLKSSIVSNHIDNFRLELSPDHLPKNTAIFSNFPSITTQVESIANKPINEIKSTISGLYIELYKKRLFSYFTRQLHSFFRNIILFIEPKIKEYDRYISEEIIASYLGEIKTIINTVFCKILKDASNDINNMVVGPIFIDNHYSEAFIRAEYLKKISKKVFDYLESLPKRKREKVTSEELENYLYKELFANKAKSVLLAQNITNTINSYIDGLKVDLSTALLKLVKVAAEDTFLGLTKSFEKINKFWAQKLSNRQNYLVIIKNSLEVIMSK